MVSDSRRIHLIRLCGLAIIALGVLSALLPAASGLPSSTVGLLLVVAGIIEIFAGTLRKVVHVFAISAGVVTVLAGLLFLFNPSTHFLPTVWPIIGWLIVRGFILLWKSRRTGGTVRLWTRLSAGMDLLLAVLLVAGLSIATLIIGIFGPTQPLIASFSWVLAASFVVTGNLLLEVANC
ncbi:MAG: hypothetical protein ABIS39_04330, partial [Sphingomicrobium sp.]